MIIKMKYTIKNVIENDYVWIITKVMQGYNGKIRIDAKTRFHIADESNFFSEWCTKKYADNIYMNKWEKKIQITNY